MDVSENKCSQTHVWMLIETFADQLPYIWTLPVDKLPENTKKFLLKHKTSAGPDLLSIFDCSTGELLEDLNDYSSRDRLADTNYRYLAEITTRKKEPIIIDEFIYIRY